MTPEDPMQDESAFHQFVRLLYEACHTSEAVDYFDLHSENPANVAAWNWLRGEQHASHLALLRHVQTHAKQLIATLGPPLANVPREPPPGLMQVNDLLSLRHAFLSRTASAAEKAARD